MIVRLVCLFLGTFVHSVEPSSTTINSTSWRSIAAMLATASAETHRWLKHGIITETVGALMGTFITNWREGLRAEAKHNCICWKQRNQYLKFTVSWAIRIQILNHDSTTCTPSANCLSGATTVAMIKDVCAFRRLPPDRPFEQLASPRARSVG